MERKSGVLMHISSLWGEFSIGNFGKEAYRFVDFLKKAGFTLWQVLPFCMTDENNSPFSSPSAFSVNPYFIDLEELYNKRMIDEEDLLCEKQDSPYCVLYDKLKSSRIDVLKKASKKVRNKEKILSYVKENPEIHKFCEFMALKTANNYEIWTKWNTKEFDDDEYFAWCFIVYEFMSEWKKLKTYANENGIKIIGDMPFYVSFDSSDVWGNKSLFKLNENNEPDNVSGVPPDYFSNKGQFWGNPLYNWDEMKKDGFLWWKKRFEFMLSLFDGVRIDHFRAFGSFWSIDNKSQDAKTGKWENGPGKDLINEIKEVTKNKIIIAEDLGEDLKETKELVDYSGFLSTKVFQFGFMGSDDNPHLPHNYNEKCACYTGTHDNDTLFGFLEKINESVKNELLKYCVCDSKTAEHQIDAIIRTVISSSAKLAIIPMQDLLKSSSYSRMNTPGKAHGNWKFRITKNELERIDTQKLRDINEIFKRIKRVVT